MVILVRENHGRWRTRQAIDDCFRQSHKNRRGSQGGSQHLHRRLRVGNEEAGAQRCRTFLTERAPDHGSRLIRRDPVDALVGRRNVPPGRQEQPGQQVEPGRGGFGKDRSLFIPEPTKLRPPDLFPGRRLEPCPRRRRGIGTLVPLTVPRVTESPTDLAQRVGRGDPQCES